MLNTGSRFFSMVTTMLSQQSLVLKFFCKTMLAVALFMIGATSQSATSEGQLTVNITLNEMNTDSANPSTPGVCISQSLSQKTNALVRVVCGRDQFVSITAKPSTAFLGAHGGAFRYVIDSKVKNSGVNSCSQEHWEYCYPEAGIGTVTAMRVYNSNGSSNGSIEILLTF